MAEYRALCHQHNVILRTIQSLAAASTLGILTIIWITVHSYGSLIGLLLLVTCFLGIKLLYVSRSVAMGALAHRLDLHFREGKPNILYLPRKHHPLPTSFNVKGSPWSSVTRAWNFIEGEKNGVKVLIFDSTLGSGRGKGIYSTFVAVGTDKNPFEYVGPEMKIAHSNGWTALYRIRFWQVPWTLSTQCIEEYVEHVSRQA